MDKELSHLIQTLRDELQQYGEMLVRLDHHDTFAARQAGGNLNDSADEIQSQAIAIQRARQNREQARQRLATVLRLDCETPMETMIPLLPADYQPLVNALVQENRGLLVQVLQSFQRNQFLLERSLNRMQQFLGSVFLDDSNELGKHPGNKPVQSPMDDTVAQACLRPD